MLSATFYSSSYNDNAIFGNILRLNNTIQSKAIATSILCKYLNIQYFMQPKIFAIRRLGGRPEIQRKRESQTAEKTLQEEARYNREFLNAVKGPLMSDITVFNLLDGYTIAKSCKIE